MNTSEKVKEWFDSADYELEKARVSLEYGKLLFIGLMCYHAIENALKAVIIYVTNGEEPPKAHNLSIMLEKSLLADKMNEEHLNLIKEVRPIDLDVNYSEYKDMLTQRDTKEYCHKIIEGTADFLDWIKEQLPVMPKNNKAKVTYIYHRTRS